MKRSSAMLRRASMAFSSLATDCLPALAASSSASRLRKRKISPSGLEPAASLRHSVFDALVAEAVDIEGIAADEMLQALDRLGRADEARRCSGGRAMPSSRTAWLLQTGQRSGKTKGLLPRGRFSSTTATTCGMTSPARWMMTVSPIADVLARDLVLVVQGGVG